MILANIAIPTVVPHMLAAAILLPAVALIEAVIIRRSLLPAYWPSFRTALGANWRSTLVGLPLGYLFASIGAIPAGMFTGMIPTDSQELFMTTLFQTLFVGGIIPNPSIPLAMAIGLVVVLIPYYFASVIVEQRYMIRHLPELEPILIKRVAWKMNILTYTCLMALAVENLVSVATKPTNTGQPGTGQPATRLVDKPEGGDKPQPETEGRPR